MRSILNDKKGQITLSDAPQVVLLVGLVFLVMATLALIGSKYGTAIPNYATNTTINETITLPNNQIGVKVANAKDTQCSFREFTVTNLANRTGGEVVTTTNITIDPSGLIVATTGNRYNGTALNISYTYSYAGVGCEVNGDLQTELGNNTSIAGIVLTISLIGIVLGVLIGVFACIGRKQGV